jgi:hypothetical protein
MIGKSGTAFPERFMLEQKDEIGTRFDRAMI